MSATIDLSMQQNTIVSQYIQTYYRNICLNDVKNDKHEWIAILYMLTEEQDTLSMKNLLFTHKVDLSFQEQEHKNVRLSVKFGYFFT